MPSPTGAYRFGPFELDAGRHCLLRNGEPVALTPRQIAILLLLVVNAGHTVLKDDIWKAGWPGGEVNDNSITQAMFVIRTALGNQSDESPYIVTTIRHGYRFTAPVVPGQARPATIPLEAALAPQRTIAEARAALETMKRDRLPDVKLKLEDLLTAAPESAAGHVAIVHACVFEIESTRADGVADPALVQRAVDNAHAAREREPSSGNAWGALAIALPLIGDMLGAEAAARRAIDLEPYDWGHRIRLARVSWGSVRIHAGDSALDRCPGLAIAYWLIVPVFIARQAFGPALEILDAGCAAQDAQLTDGGRVNGLGLHYLRALVLGAQNRVEEAVMECGCELASKADGHVYARECYSNAWYTMGAFYLRQDRHDDAAAAFRQALRIVPGHALAALGLAAARRAELPLPRRLATAAKSTGPANPMDATIFEAASLAIEGKHPEAAHVIAAALDQAPAGSAGWQVVTEPLIHATAHPEAWAKVFAILRDRATLGRRSRSIRLVRRADPLTRRGRSRA